MESIINHHTEENQANTCATRSKGNPNEIQRRDWNETKYFKRNEINGVLAVCGILDSDF